MTIDEVAQRLARHRPQTLPSLPSHRRAAVLLGLLELDDTLRVLLTRRSARLNAHAGQVSFPGGAQETGDTGDEETALRETHEEIGVQPQQVRMLGGLDEMYSHTGFHIVPYVGHMEVNRIPGPCSDEVEHVFSIPLSLLRDETRWVQRPHSYRDHEVKLWHFEYDGEDVWGITAFLLRSFLDVLGA